MGRLVDTIEDAFVRPETRADGDPEGSVAVRRTGRWRGIVAVVLLALAIGVIAKRPAVLLVAAVGVAFAAYPRTTAVPDPDVSIERRLTPASPTVGDAVAVETTVRNDGDETLFDLRIVDGVPPLLSIDEGSPRCATTLAPGEEAVLEYGLRARPGRHRFQPAVVLCRDASGSIEVETTESADTTLECAARIPEVPLRTRGRHRTGRLVTDEGGSGLEFHQIKAYERGDPVSRIDWRRFARNGELTSLEFRAERLADVLVCVDARAAAYRAESATAPHAVARATDAAGRIAEALFDADQRVGLAAFGRDRCLLPPGAGRDHEERLRRRLTEDPAFSPVPPKSARTNSIPSASFSPSPTPPTGAPLDRQLSTIRAALDPNAQVLLLTPLCDDEASRIAQEFESSAAVTVISPDVTTSATAGGRVARRERKHRLTALRNAGIPAVDWNPDEPLGAALAAVERWDR